eukprot:213265-Rhodomonas_salina.2
MLLFQSYNCFPYTHTTVTFPLFAKFKITIQTWHVDDRGQQENIHKLDGKMLKKREVLCSLLSSLARSLAQSCSFLLAAETAGPGAVLERERHQHVCKQGDRTWAAPGGLAQGAPPLPPPPPPLAFALLAFCFAPRAGVERTVPCKDKRRGGEVRRCGRRGREERRKGGGINGG